MKIIPGRWICIFGSPVYQMMFPTALLQAFMNRLFPGQAILLAAVIGQAELGGAIAVGERATEDRKPP